MFWITQCYKSLETTTFRYSNKLTTLTPSWCTSSTISLLTSQIQKSFSFCTHVTKLFIKFSHSKWIGGHVVSGKLSWNFCLPISTILKGNTNVTLYVHCRFILMYPHETNLGSLNVNIEKNKRKKILTYFLSFLCLCFLFLVFNNLDRSKFVGKRRLLLGCQTSNSPLSSTYGFILIQYGSWNWSMIHVK